MKTRAALPTRPIPQLVVGHDTTAQARENRARIVQYLSNLAEQRLALPADPTRSSRLGIAQIGREAGVCIGVLRQGSPLRVEIETAEKALGLAAIAKDDRTFSSLSIKDLFERLRGSVDRIADDLGKSRENVDESLEDLEEILIRNAKGDPTANAADIIDDLRGAGDSSESSLPRRLKDMLAQLQTWVSASDAPIDLEIVSFPDALAHVLGRHGGTQVAIAAELGMKPNTISRWLKGRSVPNARSFTSLRTLSSLAGLPEEFLIEAAFKFDTGQGPKLTKHDVPERFRHRSYRHIVADAKARLTDDDFALSTIALQNKIGSYCEEAEEQRQPGRDRHKLRLMNRIDRARFSASLKEDIAQWQSELRDNNRSPETVEAYSGLVEAVLAFALSDKIPSSLRLNAETARISHLASPVFLSHYFELMVANRRAAFGDPTSKICRTSVERVKAIQSMFHPIDGFIQKNRDRVDAIAELGGEHLFFDYCLSEPAKLLNRVHYEIGEVRKKWMKETNSPTAGKSEIADLLEERNPIRAVTAMIMAQRDIALRLLNSPRFSRSVMTQDQFSTASRKLIVLHVFAQTGMRVGMLPKLTVGRTLQHHLRVKDGCDPTFTIEASLFKNEDSPFFKEGPYKRVMQNFAGFAEDFRLYMDKARPILLDRKKSDTLFPVKGGSPISASNLRDEIYKISANVIGRRAPPELRLVASGYLKPHHFRDILATQILHDSNRDYALAADAIHVTEATCREHYAHDTPEMRQPKLYDLLINMGED